MLRNVFLFLVLAALAATSAPASPAPSAKSPRYAHTISSRYANAGLVHRSGTSHRAAPANRRASAPSQRLNRYHGAAPNQRLAPLSPRTHTVRRYRPRQHFQPLPVRDFRSTQPVPAPEPIALHPHRYTFVPPLKGSLESLTRQNQMADAEGLERILDEDDLNDRIAHNLLVPVPVSAALGVNPSLAENHRYCRPWTADFLADFARAHALQFHTPLLVTSAVRTVAYQKQLMYINGNAAAAEGDVVSPHLTGATIDIAKQGMSRQELGWMRNALLALQVAGKLDVEEEFKQACFHITVYKTYTSPAPATASTRRHLDPSLQIAAGVR